MNNTRNLVLVINLCGTLLNQFNGRILSLKGANIFGLYHVCKLLDNLIIMYSGRC